MEFTLIGWSHYGFTADNGKYLEGYKFHVSRPSTAQDFHGSEVAVVSISEKLVQQCGEPQTGSTYHVWYDQKGRVIQYKLKAIEVTPTTKTPRAQ